MIDNLVTNFFYEWVRMEVNITQMVKAQHEHALGTIVPEEEAKTLMFTPIPPLKVDSFKIQGNAVQ